MALQIAKTQAVLTVDWPAGTYQILNAYTANDTVNTTLTKPGGLAQVAITPDQLNGSLQAFLNQLLTDAKAREGIP